MKKMGCEKFRRDDTEWLRMYVSKAEWFSHTLTTAKEIIAECKDCIYTEFCKDKYKMVRMIDEPVID